MGDCDKVWMKAAMAATTMITMETAIRAGGTGNLHAGGMGGSV